MSPSHSISNTEDILAFERAQDVLMLLLALASGAKMDDWRPDVPGDFYDDLLEDRRNLFREVQSLKPTDTGFISTTEKYLGPWLNAYIDRIEPPEKAREYVAWHYPGLAGLLAHREASSTQSQGSQDVQRADE